MTTPAPRDQGGRYQRDRSSTTSDPILDGSGFLPQSVAAQLRRRRAAAWRCEPLSNGLRDPWLPDRLDWSDDEIDSWVAAVQHLRSQGLYASWQLPASVRVAWYRRRSCPCRGAA
jgi:hypothetical protein